MRRLITALLLILLAPASANAADEITFTDIAAGGGAGLLYERAPSASIAIFNSLTALPVFRFADYPLSPSKPHGAPGVAILDHDGDGDLDIYVTNGPGAANSLFANQLTQGGGATFVDVALAAGVDATDQDSSGLCFGDIDNDADPDLLVLSLYGPSRLFENNGDGTFTDISAASGLGGNDRSSLSCSFGDFDDDGLLDVAIANGMIDHSSSLGIVIPFDFAQHNQVFRNLGGNQFADVSTTSGIVETAGFAAPRFNGSPTLTWAIAAVDYDLDGDVDIIHADNQGGVPLPRDGGVNYGSIHFFSNDGTGSFTDTTGTSTPASAGSWMGLSFGDFNQDGHLDVFASNLGDYASTIVSPLDPVYADFLVYLRGDMASRWYLGGPGGTLSDPGPGLLRATPAGWGTSAPDYDNDGDVDIIFHGGLYFGPVGQGAPGSILVNDGSAQFTRDADALAGSTDHEARAVQGLATGDLDGNGFDDIASVSSFDVPAANQATYNHAWGSPFDGGRYAQIFLPTGDLSGDSVFSGNFPDPGTLSVELSSGNGNRSVRVRTLGTIGITSGGSVNRDGIGAVVAFTTASGKRVLRPVIGGSSYASQDALEGTFGLGRERRGTVEILWPGGIRNRLYNVPQGSRVVFPEIPCGFDDDWSRFSAYRQCVAEALDELIAAGVVSRGQRGWFLGSALRAFRESR